MSLKAISRVVVLIVFAASVLTGLSCGDKKEESARAAREHEAICREELGQLSRVVGGLSALRENRQGAEAQTSLEEFDRRSKRLLVACPEASSEVESLKATADSQREDIASLTEIEAHPLIVLKSTWRKTDFGGLALWTVTFKNVSDRPVGDIAYRTRYSSETGNVVGRGGVDAKLSKGPIQKIVPPGKERTIEVNDGFVHNEAVTGKFEIVSARLLR